MEAKFWLGLALFLTWESYATSMTTAAFPWYMVSTPSTTVTTSQSVSTTITTSSAPPPTTQTAATPAPITAAPVTAAPAGGSSGSGSSSGSSCNTTHCPSCPTGYHSYQEMQFGCTYRCLCELNGPATQSSPRNLLMRILGIIQNNAVALEKMAHGVSDEADLAQDIESLPHV